MTGPNRTRAAALLLLSYVLENDWGVRQDEDIIKQIDAEVWCLTNNVPYDPPPGTFTDCTAQELIKMLTSERLSPEKRLERGAFLLCTSRELACDNQPVDRG